METEILTTRQRQKLSATALAEKHGVTASYVRMILNGGRKQKSPKARRILDDAKAILKNYGENV